MLPFWRHATTNRLMGHRKGHVSHDQTLSIYRMFVPRRLTKLAQAYGKTASQVDKVKRSLQFCGNPITAAVRAHTVSPATRHKLTRPALTSASCYSIYLLQRDGRLSWPRSRPTRYRSPRHLVNYSLFTRFLIILYLLLPFIIIWPKIIYSQQWFPITIVNYVNFS